MTTEQQKTPQSKCQIDTNSSLTFSAKTMLTDLYQLTMMAGYLDSGKQDDIATFDLFIRRLPQDWGYAIANGIEDAIDYIISIRFEAEDINYLRSQGLFKEEFLDYLRTFKFKGDVCAMKEGTPVFPNEPILRVTAKRSQAQFLETALLNIINYQTLIASKASRIVHAAHGTKVVDFGLRRAQGEDAGMKGSRACYIAGVAATSNVKAGKEYGIPLSGTMAHSFDMSFSKEVEAFRAYAKSFPDNPTLLIDTYDTLQGANNAAIVAKEMESRGSMLGAVRLDSGDLCDLSKKVRKILDQQGLNHVKIFASGDLNEYKIDDLVRNNAPIDGYGVGTEMITGKPEPALSGVYKLVEDVDGPKIKLSSEKETLPGKKQVFRLFNCQAGYINDLIALQGEHAAEIVPAGSVELLEPVIRDGRRVRSKGSLDETREYSLKEVDMLPHEAKELKVQSSMQIYISPRLQALRNELVEKYASKRKEESGTDRPTDEQVKVNK
ncbi:MAG: nicotinate phosphoribosyltransferase [Nanoarchaeota archaeon]